MVTRKVTIDEVEYTLKPLTRRQFKAMSATTEDTLDEALAIGLSAVEVEALLDRPLYVSKQLFDELLDLSAGGKAEKNS